MEQANNLVFHMGHFTRMVQCVSLKGILHPKMKSLSSFTHPQVVAKLYEFLSSAEHNGRYFEERLFGTIDFHSRKKKYYGG